MSNKIFIFFILFIFISCGDNNKEVNVELEKFDNSLDSLIKEPIFNKVNFLYFYGDSLKNNPKKIEETYYIILKNGDSLKIEANCHIYTFKNNELETNSSETVLGDKFTNKCIYFNDKIDENILYSLRNHSNNDTIYTGFLKKYNQNGRLIKEVESSIWYYGSFKDKNNSKKYRKVTIYQDVNKKFTENLFKEYLQKEYIVDSLKKSKIKKIEFDDKHYLQESKDKYTFKFDKFSNWVEKKEKDLSTIVYRKYTY